MYKIILTIFYCSFWHTGLTQESSHNSYRLPTEGGGRPVTIDTITPTAPLIKMLEAPWKFQFTGKGYYIGYTDLMFSIAHKGDKVIDTLVEYYKTTQSEQAQLGIIYTLHLIGIERTVAGRAYEAFKSKKARKALLSLLHYTKNNETISKLLMRDPWLSDIPELISYLSIEKNTEFTWPIVKALIRYNIPGFCIGQKVTSKAYIIRKGQSFEKVLNSPPKISLKLFEEKYPDVICVEQTLFEQSLHGDYATSSGDSISLIRFSEDHNTGTGNYFTSYMALGSRFVHYEEGDSIHFCSIETAQKRIVEWWAVLSSTEQAFFKYKDYYNRP